MQDLNVVSLQKGTSLLDHWLIGVLLTAGLVHRSSSV